MLRVVDAGEEMVRDVVVQKTVQAQGQVIAHKAAVAYGERMVACGGDGVPSKIRLSLVVALVPC
jgi:hypothetical protein